MKVFKKNSEKVIKFTRVEFQSMTLIIDGITCIIKVRLYNFVSMTKCCKKCPAQSQ